jgi:CheY-like chemotaxis protein
LADTNPRPRQGTAPELMFVIAALSIAVIIADLSIPLGLAAWVFYMLPLGACLYSQSPLLPLKVALLITGAVVLLVAKPLAGQAVAERWVALVNRGMYVTMLWPVAVMIQRLIATRVANQREEWIRGTQASLLASLQGDLSPADAASRLLGGLIEALGVPVGALYLRSGARFDRVAMHGLLQDGVPASFGSGDGLVGQASRRPGTHVFDEVPPGFMRVEAGVGVADPRVVALSSLHANGQPVAVAAFGSLRTLSSLDSDLLERIAEPIAMALASAQHREQLRELLEESQRQAQELSSQQAELEAQQAELEANNEELTQANAMMEVQTNELEEQRRELVAQREAADRASRYKSEFLANMSHELRTPLNSSLILARLLADNREGNLNAEQVRSAETIYAAGNDLLVLINDILDLAKIEAGRADVTLEPVAIARLGTALERAFRPVAADKRLDFQVRIDSDVPERIVSDGRRLEQVLRNLLSNALKFTERGSVELSISKASADTLAFAVRDSGIGIAKHQQEIIFEAFRQADGTTSRRYGGTGLGLSISREIARMLSGDIHVESEPGRGSIFTLILPIEVRTVAGAPAAAAAPAPPALPRPESVFAREARAAEAEAAPRSPSVRSSPVSPILPDDRDRLSRPGRLILAIEDDLPFAKILYDLSHELDFDCVIAGTADEGLELVHRLAPCGVLLDVGLPDMSGLSVLERLKRDPSTRHIPVHMVSVSDNAHTALQLGAIGYALKPVARDDLARAMQRLAAEHSRETRRVLIVEDDPTQQESLKKLLEAEGVELSSAGSVREALLELERTSVDCMVLDLTLPDGSGYDLLEKMAASTRTSFPPVIVYTGRVLDRKDEERLRRHSQSIIVKGARSPERLLDEVSLFLHQVEASLPAAQRRMLADARQRDAALEGRCILVVEDDVRNVFALSKVLEPRGARVEIARNGREALAMLERHADIDLVLMDLMMPEMDGLTAMREIRKNPARQRLPIIALTAKAMADDREQALAAGANDYIAKPFDVDKLVSLCRVWLRR